ncbi:hypothetical protein [Cryobacterium luteum]|uniref:Uncharacterized protein n=1 Tax=Cryobacterium luteum TaxID=1424661 RepID=A0A1H8HHP9_9MICO|nr:hypothetical protein [Cryobacterium luteum]TFB86664.1 hypothetical protein E3O10_13665 [Cryobacterium luteum]SEN55670.1 hypothetical protein SAMN05216281_109118 [Cryobacterium luteum]
MTTKQPHFQAELALDEYRVVLQAAPDLVMPASLRVGTLAESGPDADRRGSAAVAALTGRQLLGRTAVGPGDVAGDPHPLLLVALGLPLMAVQAMRVQSWTPTESSQTVVSVAGRLMSAVTVTVPRCTDSPQISARASEHGRVAISLGSLSLLVGHLDGLLAAAPPEPAGMRALTVQLGLVESRTLIAAIRTGDDLVTEQLATQFGATAAVPLLRSLAVSGGG